MRGSLFVAIKIGTFGLLLPSVRDGDARMLPFFARSVLPSHVGWNPLWWLGLRCGCFPRTLFVESVHGYVWLWPIDGAADDAHRAVVVAQSAESRIAAAAAHPVHRVRMAAVVVDAVRNAERVVRGLRQLRAGRAPAHALFIGFFGGLLVAMVTRVTQGHSGVRLCSAGSLRSHSSSFRGCGARVAAELLPRLPMVQALVRGRVARRLRAVGRPVGPCSTARRVSTGSQASLAVIEFYPQIKAVHVAAVLLSGALFLMRGLLVQTGRERGAMWAPVRYATYGIDTVLLTAALMLVAALPSAMFANHWLALKLVLLVVYVVLGWALSSLGRAQTASRERTFAPRAHRDRAASLFHCGVAIYMTMLGIARAHHPLGWLHVARETSVV